MCDHEEGYGQLLEEYRGFVDSLVDSLINQLVLSRVEGYKKEMRIKELNTEIELLKMEAIK